ncbi:MAG: hydroxylamine reductase, partial [Candidatus Bathyarchaeia archaeon]
MFCWQCEQTAKGTGCTSFGVCGKSPDVANLQDLLIYLLRGLSQVAVEGRKVGVKDEKIDVFIAEATFATLTNVNFDPEDLAKRYIQKTVELRETLKAKVKAAGGKVAFGPAADLIPEKTIDGMVKQGKKVGVKADSPDNPDLQGLKWLLIYGIKGVAAYTYHAYRFGKKDDNVFFS